MQSITTWTFKKGEPLQWASRFADIEGTVFLHSCGPLETSRSSFLCLFPKEKIALPARPGVWEALQQRCGVFDPTLATIPKWVGFLGYEMGGFADPDTPLLGHTTTTPGCCFYAPSVVMHFDHTTQEATLFAEATVANLEREAPPVEGGPLTLGFCSDTLETYLEKIGSIKESILDGEFYQVNLSQEIHFEGHCSPFSLFEKSVLLNPTSFSAYMNCGAFAIVSASPERFIKKEGRFIEARPIKGTMPRGRSEIEEREMKKALMSSSKERAELLMIVDLMRNDIGKIALPGSVHVKEIWRCETYAAVFHLVSIIEGEVAAESHPIELLRSLFPGGSITGCPKLRAMEAIAALEKRGRGIYTGSLGYIAANGDFDFNIAIRTLVVHPEYAQLQLGGAIVIDSDPHKEYEETLHKGKMFFKILGMEREQWE